MIHPKNDPSNKTLLAAVPLAVIDASICWPTPEEMAEEYEKERVLYDNISLTELIQNDKRKQEEEKLSIKLR